AATELVHRAVPSLTDRLVKRVADICDGRPGELRRFVRRIAERAVASEQDLEDLLGGIGSPRSILPEDPLERAVALLDRGRYPEAREALSAVRNAGSLAAAVAWARLDLALGETAGALERLLAVEPLAKASPESATAMSWTLYVGRARYGLGEYAAA